VAVFEEARAVERDGFCDSRFHGADWKAYQRTYAKPLEHGDNRRIGESYTGLDAALGERLAQIGAQRAPPALPVIGVIGYRA